MVSAWALIHLFKEFFLIGLFSFGGGYATLPFLYNLTQNYTWYTVQELNHMIAVATITPGPVGINVATYAGMKAGGIITALVATTSEIIPALIIGLFVSKLLKNFSDSFWIKSAIWALKPASCALLSYVAIKLFYQNIINNSNLIISGALFCIFLTISILKTKDPLWYISIFSVIGVLFVKIGIL